MFEWVGYGELMVFYGFLLVFGGVEFFEFVEMKGDFGVFVFGMFIVNYFKVEELVKVMFGFKDFFLIGFFLLIGFVS